MCHIVDVSHGRWEDQYRTVESVLRDLDAGEVERLLVFNKVDRLTHEEQEALERRGGAVLGPHVFSSTVEDGGVESLREALREAIRDRWPTVSLTISAGDGGLLAEVYREGEVLAREQNGMSIQMTARLPREVVGRLRSRNGVAVEGPSAA